MAYLRYYLEEIRRIYDEARVEYTKIQDKLEEKEKAFFESQRRDDLTRTGKERKRMVWYEERADLQGQLRELIETCQKKFGEMRGRVEIAYRDAFSIVPENVDQNAMAILSLGAVPARDLIKMTDRYKNNYTMLRVIAKYAEDILQKDPRNTELREFVAHVNHIGNPHLDAVDALIFVAEQGLREDRVTSDGVARQLFDKTADDLIAQYGGMCTE